MTGPRWLDLPALARALGKSQSNARIEATLRQLDQRTYKADNRTVREWLLVPLQHVRAVAIPVGTRYHSWTTTALRDGDRIAVRCDCGREATVAVKHLISGASRRCQKCKGKLASAAKSKAPSRYNSIRARLGLSK